MNNNQYEAEKISFWQLIKKYEIIIPIIQRDYAQGREEKQKIRDNFLKALEKAFDNPEELDFIYGGVKNNCLYPLDGQQRLTTLFLLHWYLAAKDDCLDNDTRKVLLKFSYETRTSSSDFCAMLIDNSIAIDKNSESLSSEIKDAWWFVLAWEKDPTIKAMLIMLNSIHEKFKDKDSLWGKLTIDENRPITFNFIEIKNFGLSDDLYIKMNARGKQLTAFENFKASFEKRIEDENWEDGINITETFSHKADTSWTDLFWNPENNLFDEAYITFISNTLINSIAISNKGKEREYIIQRIFNNPQEVNPEDFEKDSFLYLCNCLDIYINKKAAKSSIHYWHLLQKSDTLFLKAQDPKSTYPQRVLLYGQTSFLLSVNNYNQQSFDNWMRVIRNIVLNSTIDSAEPYIGAINLVKELSTGCENIYAFLATQNITSQFASSQVKEEVLKAKLIISSIENKITIDETEDLNFCKGRIGFALYCIDYEKEQDVFDSSKLLEVTKVLSDHLEGDEITNKFRRGLLTINDTNFYNYWWSWLYAVNCPKRCLIENIEYLKRFAYNKNLNGRFEFRDYLKKLIILLTTQTLDDLLEVYTTPIDMPNWKKRLIKEPNLLDFSHKHYIAPQEDNSCCYLIPQSRVANSDEGVDRLMKID